MQSLSFYFRNWLLFSANIFLCPFCLSFQVQLFKHLSCPAPEILLLISNNIGVSRVKSSVTPTVATTMGSVLHVYCSPPAMTLVTLVTVTFILTVILR